MISRMISFLLLGIVLSSVFFSFCNGQTKALSVENKTPFSKLSAQTGSVWEASAQLRNLSETDQPVTVREVSRNLPSGSKINFCWGGKCAENESGKCPAPVVIRSGALNTSFKVFLKTSGSDMSASVTYRFTGKDGKDSADVQFVFSPTGKMNQMNHLSASAVPVALTGGQAVADEIPLQGTVDAYPNPASQQTTIEYSLTANFHAAYVRIYDLMGKEVSQYDVEEPSGTLKINLRNFNEGVYFFNLVADGKSVATKRLIVSK